MHAASASLSHGLHLHSPGHNLRSPWCMPVPSFNQIKFSSLTFDSTRYMGMGGHAFWSSIMGDSEKEELSSWHPPHPPTSFSLASPFTKMGSYPYHLATRGWLTNGLRPVRSSKLLLPNTKQRPLHAAATIIPQVPILFEGGVLRTKAQSCQRFPFSQSGVGQDIVLHAAPADRTSTLPSFCLPDSLNFIFFSNFFEPQQYLNES